MTQPEPLSMMRAGLPDGLAHTELISSLEEAELDRLAQGMPVVAAVLGVGGGAAMDAAKFIAWQRAIPLYLAPSAVSVDACVTNTVAVRSAGKVDYRGFVVAERIFVDFGLISRAPARMNRAGLGDLLSIHTALWDWRHGAGQGGAELIPEAARSAAQILRAIEERAADIYAVSPPGIEALVRAYVLVNEIASDVGHAQAEEGSEHYFAYCLEHVTGRSFIHGEVVTLGAVLMAEMQGNSPGRVRALADDAGVRWRPPELGVSRDDMDTTLRELPGFVRDAGLPWSVIDEARIDEATVSMLAEAVR
jgi:glycerol-1-phosphate dehydrogenase [NAD(P)+]